MLTAAVFNCNYLVQKEIIAALRALPHIKLLVLNTADVSSEEDGQRICAVLAQHGCRMVFTINDWGLDYQEVVSGWLERRGVVHVNWCVDDPFFLAEYKAMTTLGPRPNRIDFVSDRAYLGQMKQLGYRAHFLPLGTDPALFFPLTPAPTPVRSVCFVGNSYFKKVFLEYTKPHESFWEQCIPFVVEVVGRYIHDFSTDIDALVRDYLRTLTLPSDLPFAKAVFIAKHTIGFFYRQRAVTTLAAHYDDFMAFGDEWWLKYLPPRQVSLAVGYYTNLNETYQQTAINVDINRVVIREGFTQRVFDCLGARAFCITSAKAVVDEYFETKGELPELVVFDSEQELYDKVAYYHKNPSLRQAIAQRGYERVIQNHTYHHRVATLFALLRSELGSRAS
jgi:spore maturation protein CgeB